MKATIKDMCKKERMRERSKGVLVDIPREAKWEVKSGEERAKSREQKRASKNKRELIGKKKVKQKRVWVIRFLVYLLAY